MYTYNLLPETNHDVEYLSCPSIQNRVQCTHKKAKRKKHTS